jgi:hypothetical protein
MVKQWRVCECMWWTVNECWLVVGEIDESEIRCRTVREGRMEKDEYGEMYKQLNGQHYNDVAKNEGQRMVKNKVSTRRQL